MAYQLPPIFRDSSPIGNNPRSSSGYQLPPAFQETQQPGWMPSTDYTQNGTYIVDVPYVSPENYKLPAVFTDPIDYSPQVANIANNMKTQVQGIQSQVQNMKLVLPDSYKQQIQSGIEYAKIPTTEKQMTLVKPEITNIKQSTIQYVNMPTTLSKMELSDSVEDWARESIQKIENSGIEYTAMAINTKDLNDILKITNDSMKYIGDVYKGLDTAIKTSTDKIEFKLIPLVSTGLNAVDEMQWRIGKTDLNSILPKMDKGVQKQLIAEDTIKRNEEYLKTHDGLKTNLYTAAKTYYNADADVLREMFASDKATANVKDIERVQFYFNPENKNEVKAFEQRTGTDYISGNTEDTLYRYDLNIAKTETGIAQQATLGTRQTGVKEAISAEEAKREEQSQRMKQQQFDAANTKNALKKAALELETAKNAEKMPMQVKVGDNITLDFNKGTMLVGDTQLLMSKKETPVTSRKMESYTSLIKKWADNEDDAILKTVATAVYDLTATDKQKLINGGYATSSIVTSAKDIENKEWSMLDGLYMIGKALKSETSHQQFGTERLSATEMWAGQTVVELNSKGKELANTLGEQWATTGKQTNNLGLSDTAVKQFVMENAKPNVIADIAINRPKDVAMMATNALTRSSVDQALSQSDISAILAANPLTDADRNKILKDQAYQIGAVVTDFDVTGTPVDLVIGIGGLLTGGFIGETDLAAKGIKLVKASQAASEVSDLLKYAKTASVLAKDSDLANTAILKATKASNIAVVTPSPGTIARGVTPNSIDIKKASSIEVTAAKAPLADKATAVKVKEFNTDVQRAVAQPNVAAPSILTKTQMPGTSKTTNAQKLMDNIANGDESTIRAALVENIATDPSSLYKAMTVAAVKSDPATVTKAFQRLEEANQIYVKAANDLVKDVVDSGQGATRLAELSNSLGDATVIKMLDTAMGMGETGARMEPTPLINEITNIRREWETLRKIESTPVSVAPTGARQISQQAYDIENVMPDVVVSRINRVSSDVKINRIEDIASLSDEQITTLSKSNIGLEEKDLLNYREKASQILGKEGTALEDVSVTAFQRKETTPTSWVMGEKDTRLDDEYKALFSADNLKSQATAKRGDIEKLQNAAQSSIGRPLDTMDDFKSLTNKEIDALSKNVPSVSKSDITGYRVQATKEMDKLSQARQTYDKLGTEDYTNLVKLQQQRAADLASTADEYRNLLRNTERTADQERRMEQLGVRLEEQRSILQATTEAIDARKMQMEQWKTKQLTAADIKPGTKDRKTAAINAIDAAKKGDYETAIKKFAEARTHDGRSVLSKVDAKHYDGMSIQRINRMEEAVPADQMSKGMKEMLERMRQERRDFAIDALSKKGDDFKRAAFKIKNGDELDELERLKLWNSGDEIRTLAKDALDDVNGNKLVKGLVDDAVKKGDTARAKNLQTSMKEELEKCIKRGECGGGGFGGVDAVLVGAAAMAGTGSLVGSSEATIIPGTVNINEGTASPISSKGYAGTLPVSGWKTIDIDGTKVEGSTEGMANFQNALNWIKSSENTIASSHEYDNVTEQMGEREVGGTIQSIMAPKGRGNTYMCEQYAKDTATELEKLGIKDVYIALTGKETTQEDGGKYTTGHSLVAIKTGERQDAMTGKMVPVFALVETISGKDLGRTYMLGTGTPLTNVGADASIGNAGIGVDHVTLIKASDFIDVGTKGIALPNAEVIQYTPEVEYMQAMSRTVLSTPERKMGGTLATSAGIERAVSEGRITQEDASRLKSAQGLN